MVVASVEEFDGVVNLGGAGYGDSVGVGFGGVVDVERDSVGEWEG